MDQIPEDKRKSIFKEWLEKLQQESWQLELLISGLALYGIFEARPLLLELEFYKNETTQGFFHDLLGPLNTVLKIGWRVFFINLLAHVILRGLWIGAIGLRYVSGDIDYETLRYSDRFNNFLKKKIGSFDDFIESLERICSVLFAFTFLIFSLFASFIFFIIFLSIVIFILTSTISNPMVLFPTLGFVTIAYFLFGMIVFIDFIGLGVFKRVKDKSFSKVFFFLFRFYSLITFSFLYRPLLYNFFDHRYTRRLFYMFIPYLIIVGFAEDLISNETLPFLEEESRLIENGQFVNNSYYEDLRQKTLSELSGYDYKAFKIEMGSVLLSQFYVDKPYASVFIKFHKNDFLLFQEKSDINLIYDHGFSFDLLRNGRNRAEDPVIDSLKNLETVAFEVKKQYRLQLRDSLKIFRKANDKTKIDEIVAKQEELGREFDKIQEASNAAIEEYRKTQYEASKAFILSQVALEIDGRNLADSCDCNYYKHPNKGEQGLLCHFSTANLSLGPHELSAVRTFARDGREFKTRTRTYKLPFYRVPDVR